MDYGKFLEDDFDPKQWINNAFEANQNSGIPNDQYATTLVMKLQMYLQEVNHVIEDTSSQVVQNVPRIVREIEAVQQEATLLKDQESANNKTMNMVSVKRDIEKVECETAQSMNTLVQLDKLKTRMTDASRALKEADNWTNLSADVEKAFDSGDITAVSEKLVSMAGCLSQLTHVQNYEERVLTLENLKNRLESIISPQLVTAFNSQNLDMIKLFASIFRDIGRLEVIERQYQVHQRIQLINFWRRLVMSYQVEEKDADTTAVISTSTTSTMSQIERDLDDDHETANVNETVKTGWRDGVIMNILDLLSEWFDHLLSMWHAQTKWCSHNFGESATSLMLSIFSFALENIDPPLSKIIPKSIDDIESLYDSREGGDDKSKTIDFSIINKQLELIISINTIMENFEESIRITPPTVSPTNQSINITSGSFVEDSTSISDESFRSFVKLLFLPIRDLAERVYLLLNSLYDELLDDISLDHPDIMTSIKLLCSSHEKFIKAISRISHLSIQISKGFSPLMLAESTESFLVKFVREYRRVLRNLEEKCRDRVLSDDDWAFFEQSLKLTYSSGELIADLDEENERVLSSLRNSPAGQILNVALVTPRLRQTSSTTTSTVDAADSPSVNAQPVIKNQDDTPQSSMVPSLQSSVTSTRRQLFFDLAHIRFLRKEEDIMESYNFYLRLFNGL